MFFNIIATIIPGIPPPDPKSVVVLQGNANESKFYIFSSYQAEPTSKNTKSQLIIIALTKTQVQNIQKEQRMKQSDLISHLGAELSKHREKLQLSTQQIGLSEQVKVLQVVFEKLTEIRAGYKKMNNLNQSA